MNLLAQVASDDILDQAFDWVCRQREHHSPNSDVWWLRFNWHTIKPQLQQQLLRETQDSGLRTQDSGAFIAFRLCVVM
jgi:hypothetical protein